MDQHEMQQAVKNKYDTIPLPGDRVLRRKRKRTVKKIIDGLSDLGTTAADLRRKFNLLATQLGHLERSCTQLLELSEGNEK